MTKPWWQDNETVQEWTIGLSFVACMLLLLVFSGCAAGDNRTCYYSKDISYRSEVVCKANPPPPDE